MQQGCREPCRCEGEKARAADYRSVTVISTDKQAGMIRDQIENSPRVRSSKLSRFLPTWVVED